MLLNLNLWKALAACAGGAFEYLSVWGPVDLLLRNHAIRRYFSHFNRDVSDLRGDEQSWQTGSLKVVLGT